MSSIFFYEPLYHFDRLLDEAFASRRGGQGNQGQQRSINAAGEGAVEYFKPRMDLHEDSEKNLVSATFELPGLVKENVNIDVHGNRLTVSAESKRSGEYDEHGFAVRERYFGKFSRTLQLPSGVQGEDVKASMNNGVLTVTFPKSTPEMAPKKITVS